MFLLSIITSSCVTLNYDTNYDQQTKVSIKKMAIISEDTRKEGFVKEFSDEFSKQVKYKRIATIDFFKDSLSFLTSDEIKEKVQNFNADIVVEIKRLDTSYNPNNQFVMARNWYRGGTYYIGIKKTGNEKIFWKSVINVENEHLYSNENKQFLTKKVAEILAKIEKDCSM